MNDHIYSITEIAGSSRTGLEDAIKNGVNAAARTLRNLDWFKVTEIRGHLAGGMIEHYQVQMKLGLRFEPPTTGTNSAVENVRSSKDPNPLVTALSRWESEGGTISTAESETIISHLGAAVLAQWNKLSREAQRDLFNAAVDMNETSRDPEIFKQHIAVFLHHNKNREQETVDKGGEGGGAGSGA